MPFCSLTLTAKKPSKTPFSPGTIGQHIKKRRLELGLTQAQLGADLGVSECTITGWENHRTKPQLHLMPNVLEFLGYNPSDEGPKSLGERLLKYRKDHGVSQRDLAKLIGIDPTTLSRIERNQGRRVPSVLRRVDAFLKPKA